MADPAAAAKPNSGSGETTAATGETKPATGETTTATGETKPAAGDTKPASGETTSGETSATKPAGTAGAGDQKPKAPEKYALTIPEGGRLDQATLAQIEAAARAADLTNEEAQARVDDLVAAIDAQSTRFMEETTADTVYGGARLEETTKLASAALDKLRPAGTPRGDAFRALLHRTGYGNHLEVVSLLADLGSLMREDGTAGGTGSTGGPAQVPLANALYPTMK